MNRSPLNQMSAKRRRLLAEQGIYPSSTFVRPQSPVDGENGGSKPLSVHGLKTSAKKSQSRPQPAVPGDVRTALRKRSGGWCEAQLEGCFRFAMDPHHRITQKAGGRHGEAKQRSDRLSNVIYLCRFCHDVAHHKPFSVTNAMGLRLGEWQAPTQVPVLYRGQPSYLTDDGQVVSYEKAGA